MLRVMTYLEFIRRQRGLTQWQLAIKAKINQTALSRIERGEPFAAKDECLALLSAALKVYPPEVLLKPVTAMPEATPGYRGPSTEAPTDGSAA